MNNYAKCIDLLNEMEKLGVDIVDLRIANVMSDIFEDDYYNIDNDKLDEIIEESKKEYFGGCYSSGLYDIVETIVERESE